MQFFRLHASRQFWVYVRSRCGRPACVKAQRMPDRLDVPALVLFPIDDLMTTRADDVALGTVLVLLAFVHHMHSNFADPASLGYSLADIKIGFETLAKLAGKAHERGGVTRPAVTY